MTLPRNVPSNTPACTQTHIIASLHYLRARGNNAALRSWVCSEVLVSYVTVSVQSSIMPQFVICYTAFRQKPLTGAVSIKSHFFCLHWCIYNMYLERDVTECGLMAPFLIAALKFSRVGGSEMVRALWLKVSLGPVLKFFFFFLLFFFFTLLISQSRCAKHFLKCLNKKKSVSVTEFCEDQWGNGKLIEKHKVLVWSNVSSAKCECELNHQHWSWIEVDMWDKVNVRTCVLVNSCCCGESFPSQACDGDLWRGSQWVVREGQKRHFHWKGRSILWGGSERKVQPSNIIIKQTCRRASVWRTPAAGGSFTTRLSSPCSKRHL